MLLRCYPDQVKEIVKLFSILPIEYEHFIFGVLWMCNSKESKRELENFKKETEALNELINQEPFDLLTRRVSSPEHLDMIWAEFMVTGKKEYVTKVIESLGLDGIIGGLAGWSLISMGYQHTRILEICREEVKTISISLKPLLIDVINISEEKIKAKNN